MAAYAPAFPGDEVSPAWSFKGRTIRGLSKGELVRPGKVGLGPAMFPKGRVKRAMGRKGETRGHPREKKVPKHKDVDEARVRIRMGKFRETPMCPWHEKVHDHRLWLPNSLKSKNPWD